MLISTFEVKIQSLKNARLNHAAMKQHSLLRLLYFGIHGIADIVVKDDAEKKSILSSRHDDPESARENYIATREGMRSEGG